MERTYLQGASIWTNDSLSPLHKPLLVPHNVSYFDDITSNTVVQYLGSLCHSYTTSQKLDHVSSFENDVRVISFPSRFNGH